jgi:hypothetical protein
MYGLINTGASKKQQAISGLSKSASDENNRNIANKNIKQAESAQKKTNASTGAATGATIGATMASNMGLGAASIGASALASGGIGLAAGLLLSELF